MSHYRAGGASLHTFKYQTFKSLGFLSIFNMKKICLAIKQ